ncbi:phosphate ABC transporter permease [Vibrio sp. 10N.286.49.C2]|uniref:ABC transporter permease subunit n=1 Tax=unclassified Vibrio TaxID=2614977 RepID=UPI000C81E7A8|nr:MULTISPECIES: ABC transporter permease subunit [unclassified Vibrio]PMH33340.1 phosphate ABC transporter permease [Vibrio sp. 10N.286.49.C2]PMH48237.1 phosphate ABC transporter permease [Vibrio sp. 10N.286.49.B1]PMH80403.1 phosphate ABC transporter permease [Vibrio sp. 10N.286.48.B7]
MANASFSLHTKDRKRQIQDRLVRWIVSFGGLSVLAGLIFIFVYLAFVTFPIFSDAKITWLKAEPIELTAPIITTAVDDNATKARFYTSDGIVTEKSLVSGQVTQSQYLQDGAELLSSSSKWLILLRNGNQLAAVTPSFDTEIASNQVVASDNNRLNWIVASTDGQPVVIAAAAKNQKTMSFATIDALGHVHLIQETESSNDDLMSRLSDHVEKDHIKTLSAQRTTSISDDNTPITGANITTSNFTINDADQLLLTPNGNTVYVRVKDELYVIVHQSNQLTVREVINLRSASEAAVTDISLLAGAYSLLVQYDNHMVWQWFDVLTNKTRVLTPIRSFEFDASVEQIIPENLSKGFLARLGTGEIQGRYTTSEKAVSDLRLPDGTLQSIGLSNNNRYAALVIDNVLHIAKIDNEHPEISWSALWGKVWYESYPEPEFVWQTTAANDDFEPKFSLVPIAFGTIKAAAFAMLFAAPIAVFGAIYTAYFMSSGMRKVVKPTIELMEALPTVIIGFLAGMWFAPIVESHLPAVMMLLITLPLLSLASGIVWYLIPKRFTGKLPSGLHPFTLIPVIIIAMYLMMTYSYDMEVWMFGGDVRVYLAQHGIDFDQRNALVVGFAMGFAVIPTIFTIAEDAIFSVPKHLCDGSLALGATQWQTLLYVVLLTASPGIFSAVMMGLGRAVGETMIVLMATGNTPILDWNIFESMRTLSATMAVELPESDVGSTHYRLLFLIALILFSFTFVVNSLAEWIRQRLREKYSAL